MLFLARILAGFFSGSISTSSAYISDITPPQERSKGMALIGVAFGLGFIFGPAIGGLLTIWGGHISSAPHFNTSFSAWWVAGLCFANFAFAWKFLKESLDLNLRKADLLQKRPSRFGLIDKYFRVELVGPLILVFFLSSISMSTMEATLILFMGDKFSWTLKEVSFGFAYLGVVITFTQGFLVRKLIPLWGERSVLRIGLALLALGLVGIPLSPTVSWMAIAMTFLAIGNGFTNPSALGSISILIPSTEQGAAMGVTQSMASLGRILGPALGGAIYAYQPEWPFLLGGLMAGFGFSIILSLFSRLPEAGKSKNEQTEKGLA